MKNFLKNIALLVLIQNLASCAYLFNKKEVPLSIQSSPSGADVIIEGRNYGKTPLTIEIEPKAYNVSVVKEGYGSTQLQLEVWQSRSGIGGIAKCSNPIDFLTFSIWSVYCRDFKKPAHNVMIPNNSAAKNNYYQQDGGYDNRGYGGAGYNSGGQNYQQQNYQRQNMGNPYYQNQQRNY